VSDDQAQLAGADRVTAPGVDNVHAEHPDVPLVDRTWAARSDDRYYQADAKVAEIGMAVAPDRARFDFRGGGPLHPDEVRAGMNARIGRAGLQVFSVILTEVDYMAYSDLAPTGRT
jgi:hypothetical protein